jgi:cobalamin biosynthetic protein CobC
MAKSASAIDMVPFSGADEPLVHGGDLEAARRLFPDAPEPFLDLSTGINPSPYPIPNLPLEAFARLPEPAALRQLAVVAAARYGAPSADHVVAAPGTQILLPLVCGLVVPGGAAILTPTYSEYAHAAALCGHAVAGVRDLAAIGDANLVLLANPNNPDGRLLVKADLLAVAKRLAARGGLLVVDEAFMDVGPLQTSLAADVARAGIVVLRSFGKFFGLGGVRLGFALAAPPVAARLAALLGPWAVSGPALAVGTAALANSGWIDTSRHRLAETATRLDAILRNAGIDIVGGTSLFRLAQTPAARELFHHVGCAGILTRRFTEEPRWLRFGLPASEAQWQRLQLAMADFHVSR